LAANAIVGFLFHSYLGGIPWELLFFTAPAVIIGARTFVLVVKSFNNHTIIKVIFAIIALIDGLVMAIHSLTKL